MSIWNTASELMNLQIEAALNVPSAQDVISSFGVEVVEYVEKHFEGESMSDSEWASL